MYLTPVPCFSAVTPFLQFTPTTSHATASHPSLGDNHQSMGGGKRRQGQQKWPRETHSISYALGLSTLPYLSRIVAHCRAASTVILLMPKATFTPSIQPNISLPRTRPPLTSAVNNLLAIRYSSILSTCPSHLITPWYAQLANSLSTPALIRTSSEFIGDMY